MNRLLLTCSVTSGADSDLVSSTNAFSFPLIIFSSNASTLLGTSVMTGGATGGGGGGGGAAAANPLEGPLSLDVSAAFGSVPLA